MSVRLPSQYAKILHGVTKGLSGDQLSRALMAYAGLLRDEHATKKLDQIEREYEELVARESGEEPIHVRSTRPLSQEVLDEMKEVFNAQKLTQDQDESLIGGVVVRKGNTIFDASINTQLSKLAQSIT